MQFHDYVTLRNMWLRQKRDRQMRQVAASMSSEKFRDDVLTRFPALLQVERDEWMRTQMIRQIVLAHSENKWVGSERPFYNVWPMAIPLARSVRLDLPMGAIRLPFPALLLRFPVGHEPFTVGTALLQWHQEKTYFQCDCWFANSSDAVMLKNAYEPGQTIEDYVAAIRGSDMEIDWSDKSRLDRFDKDSMTETILRLVAFIGLLAKDEDLVTPVVLSKDRDRYEATEDVEMRKWLEDRAARRMGRGFNVCQRLEEQAARSPHWRNPHLALFWTGPGGETPVIKLRRGSVVQRVSIAEVPTGYLGEETPEEDAIFDSRRQRIAVPKSLRFAVFKRDEYRCRICGRSALEDGVKLHVDHVVPDSKGGPTTKENLQTLCQDCNLGKSDSEM